MAIPDPERTKEVLDRVERERGVSRAWTRILAERDPDLLEHVHETVMHVLDRRDHLPRKTKALIMVCLNAFQFHEFGFRIQTQAALNNGATEEEILEALEVVGLSNIHGMSSMLPAMVEEFENFKRGIPPGGNS